MLPPRQIRPNGRGETLYAYDLEGRLHQQVTKTAGADWATTHHYDVAGRPVKVDYQDGSSATTTYNPDSTVKTQTTRESLTLTYTYDAANRPLSVVPSGTPGSGMAPLDSGIETTWDVLSRPTSQRRAADPRLAVENPAYDLASRPLEEKVGAREALGWAWNVYNQPIETRLPVGIGRSAGGFQGFRRQFTSLNQLSGIGTLGGEPQSVPLGASWAWSGSGRLWGMTTKGHLGTAVRFGYLGGAGAQPPAGNPEDAKWKLGTMTWGSMPGVDPVYSATSSPDEIWGRFGFGYRGNQGDPRDGAKIGRQAIGGGEDLFAGLGWSWGYDAGVRLTEAKAGRGSLTGEAEGPAFRYQYGKGDELQQIVDEAAGNVAGIETGAYGRILSRNGAAFSYDQAGRRTQDDRFSYLWNWRGELVEVAIKEGWGSAFAGHLVQYEYDAQGRLFSRNHLSPPAGSNGQRNLLERRAYVWEGQSLLVEAAFADQNETQRLWRKTFIPGPSGLDDAVQVIVENFAAPGITGGRLYTYLRDELGTVIGVVGEEENNDPNSPNIPARYLYSPYGEAHIEKALEVREARFEESDSELNGQAQTIEDPELQSRGALTVTFSAALDASSLWSGVAVERYAGEAWVAVPQQDLLLGYEDALELKVLIKAGWLRGSSYRVRVAGVKDKQGRSLAKAEVFDWRIAGRGTNSDFSRRFKVEYESTKAAIDTLGGRFPGGQNHLFQGQWTDPVTGIAYARARWYDGRNAGWLSEDPLLDVDSPNLYAFVGWGPQSGVDPLGTKRAANPQVVALREKLEEVEARLEGHDLKMEMMFLLRDVEPQNKREVLGQALRGNGLNNRKITSIMNEMLGPAGTCEGKLGELNCALASDTAGFSGVALETLDFVVSIGSLADLGYSLKNWAMRGLERKLRYELIKKARRNLAMNTPGAVLEYQVFRYLRHKPILRLNQLEWNLTGARPTRLGEIDIEIPEAIIEVTLRANSKQDQLIRLVTNAQMNPTGKPVILFAPNFKRVAAAEAEKLGVKVVRNFEELQRVLDGL